MLGWQQHKIGEFFVVILMVKEFLCVESRYKTQDG